MDVEGSGPTARWRWRWVVQNSVSSREGVGGGGAREEKWWSLASSIEVADTRLLVGDNEIPRRTRRRERETACLVVRFRPFVIDHPILLLLRERDESSARYAGFSAMMALSLGLGRSTMHAAVLRRRGIVDDSEENTASSDSILDSFARFVIAGMGGDSTIAFFIFVFAAIFWLDSASVTPTARRVFTHDMHRNSYHGT